MIDWDGDGIIDETIIGPGMGIEAVHRYTDVGDFTLKLTVENTVSGVQAEATHAVTIVLGAQPDIQEVILRLPTAAFAMEKTQRLTPILNKAEAVDQLIAEGKLEEAIEKRKVRLAHASWNEAFILTAQTRQLQRFVTRYADEAFGYPAILTREQ